jgi:hypothetical protein
MSQNPLSDYLHAYDRLQAMEARALQVIGQVLEANAVSKEDAEKLKAWKRVNIDSQGPTRGSQTYAADPAYERVTVAHHRLAYKLVAAIEKYHLAKDGVDSKWQALSLDQRSRLPPPPQD